MERYQTSYYDYETLVAALHEANLARDLPSFESLVDKEAQGHLPTLARSQLGDIEMLIGHISPAQLKQFLQTWLNGEMRGPEQSSLRQLCQQIRGQGRHAPISEVSMSPRGRNAHLLRVQNLQSPNWKSLFVEQVLSDPRLFGKNQLPSRVFRDLPLAGPYHGMTADLILVYSQAFGSHTGSNLQKKQRAETPKTILSLVLFNRPYASNQAAYDTRFGADEAWSVVCEVDGDEGLHHRTNDSLLTLPDKAVGQIECEYNGKSGTVSCQLSRPVMPCDPDLEARNWLWQQLLSESLGL